MAGPSDGSPLDAGGASGDSARSATDELMRRLERRAQQEPRYRPEGELARGGMGTIFTVWDRDLRRHLAMKVLHGDGPIRAPVSRQRLARFLEEAQVAAQLDHPGVAPVHEVGVDSDGRVFFTMKLVKGRDLEDVFELVFAGEAGWNDTRALGVLLRVCEAMAYAHTKGVIHRDLKPANVMVGSFGEVYVMDWGLARVLGAKPEQEPAAPVSAIITGRSEDREAQADSPFVTAEGDVVGTPTYMAPEQARGELERLSPRTDVYAIGAMLYHLLARKRPYVARGDRLSNREVLSKLLAGPPPPLQALRPEVPAELAAIVDKAMARAPEHRYDDTLALAADLRAYLEQRVVHAYEAGAWAEARKWVRRNRGAAAALGAALAAVVGGTGMALWLEGRRQAEVQRSLEQHTAAAAVAAVDRLWPIHPDELAAMREWLETARLSIARLPERRGELERFERGHAGADRETLAPARPDFELRALETKRSVLAAVLARLRDPAIPAEFRAHDLAVLELELPAIEPAIAERKRQLEAAPTWRYADPSLERERARMAAFVAHLEALARPERGWLAEIERRARDAETLRQRSIETHAAEWTAARAAIADRGRCPAYDGLDLEPQIGLVPLGQDAHSGLWEFWHVLSGERPQRGPDGRWAIGPGTGIVLILVPGGAFHVGSQQRDPEQPNYCSPEPGIDSALHRGEDWLVLVTLTPFFISKYEMTQGQWLRATGGNPSEHWAGAGYKGMPRIARTHPAEQVTWHDAERVLGRWGLDLPTEAQWERAARAGTQTTYWSGPLFSSLAGKVNFADVRVEQGELTRRVALPIDDGFVFHAPVDALEPNGWGLYGVLGNVKEWCRDWFAMKCERGQFQVGDGEHVPAFSVVKSYRGGGWRSSPGELRCSRRYGLTPAFLEGDLGVRPARRLDSPSR
jgi:formylglycine-generating enzyme required for sulfatase activity